ncbi:MAG: DUF4149 domain-containing protein [Okeania sp. SIO2H7]|nr:DUF4149 domain-containing protein [Okeania sp. SIO2H7]
MTISSIEFNKPRWQAVVCMTLGFWLSACLLLDLVIMPSMYVSGMMVEPGFTTAGSTLFSVFNRVELVCAGLGVTGLLVLSNLSKDSGNKGRTAIILSFVLLAIALIDTYALTPNMTALGANLNLFESAAEVPTAMNQMHAGYWVLELLKFALGGTLLTWCYRQGNELN